MINFSSILISPASAHKIEIAEDVGATLHIEPNDTPRAGETALTWFALTRKGGKIIPLKECDCQLAVYSEPRETAATPLAKPNLEPVSAERYQGIPGANITFPKPGAYQLELSGKPADDDSFKPFELKFDITVAAGTKKAATNQQEAIEKIEKKESQEIQNVNASQNQEQSFSLPFWTIGLVALVILGGIFAFTRRGKG
ncbi:hypothetical protein NIES267_26560 [Calothrix parasitica NIES-267]|uniref:Uncharacterized protein n=1 Tax=Calothrix parasitica NIES-267 TaxID=1973488 RepID=A0A1Z4LPL4_9CYAN|nr:hypothetical protein NIES267_26560 [Calothrix parasitica NIES-267]